MKLMIIIFDLSRNFVFYVSHHIIIIIINSSYQVCRCYSAIPFSGPIWTCLMSYMAIRLWITCINMLKHSRKTLNIHKFIFIHDDKYSWILSTKGSKDLQSINNLFRVHFIRMNSVHTIYEYFYFVVITLFIFITIVVITKLSSFL